MKRLICLIMVMLVLLAAIASCGGASPGYNREFYDTTWNFNYCYIYIGGEKLVEGKVDSWLDFENSDMIQVKVEGKIYFTHSSNVVLVNQ